MTQVLQEIYKICLTVVNSCTVDNVDQDALIFCLVGLAVAGGYIFPAVATEVSLREFSMNNIFVQPSTKK